MATAPAPDAALRQALTLASVQAAEPPSYDEELSEDLRQLDPAYEGSSSDKAARSQVQYGGSSLVPPQAAGVFTSGVTWLSPVFVPAGEAARDWSVTIQPAKLPGLATYPGPPSTGLLYARITWTQGEATYVKGPFLIDSVQPTRLHVCGRRVQVDVAWASVSGPSLLLSPIAIQASVSEGGVADDALDEYLGRWSVSDGQSSGTVAVTPGKLMAYEVNLEVMSSDAQLFLVFIGSAAGLAPGTKTIWWSPAMTAAGDWFSFGEQADERIPYNAELSWALSSTAGTYTPPTGTAPSCGLKVKVGF
jgi:hypothetical protein